MWTLPRTPPWRSSGGLGRRRLPMSPPTTLLTSTGARLMGMGAWGRSVRAGLGRGQVGGAPKRPKVVCAGVGAGRGLLGYIMAVVGFWEGNII